MSSRQVDRSLQEYATSLAPAEVLEEAKRFFSRHLNIYSTFLEQESDRHITLRGQGGEEIAIAVAASPTGTRVTGSTYLFDQQVARFFATLPPAPDDAAPGTAPAPVAQQAAHP